SPRQWLVWAHRWVALLAGLLLVLLGLTGSLMVWQAEIDRALNPAWFAAHPACDAAMPAQPVAATLAVLAQAAPQARAALVIAPVEAGAPFQVWEARDKRTGWRREHFIDAHCARYLGYRDRGAPRLDAAHAAPALYELHTRLLLGENGHTVVGIAGLTLLGLALSGVVASWPRRSTGTAWRRVFSVKRGAAPARWWYDVHRAVGMWLLPLFLLMTATGTALVFSQEARALIGTILPVTELPRMPRDKNNASAKAMLPVDELVAAANRRFPQAQWSRLTLSGADTGSFEVRLLQPAEPRVDTGNTRVRLDARGQVLAVHDPLSAPAGNRVLDWIFPLHSGEALGLIARLAWTLFGLVPALLFGSGTWLWWRRQRAMQRDSRVLAAAGAVAD
ncbi:MAG TPA: PepSY-associated TM helix domain-containing protein, partial [Burkholderiaceae bacterium]|nr:PepSY-associated TM helix domain-containing protein [Burkholderiaceae bacterium]